MVNAEITEMLNWKGNVIRVAWRHLSVSPMSTFIIDSKRKRRLSIRYIFTRRQRNLSYKPETHQLYRLKRANSPRKVLLAITIQDSGQTWEWIILSARVIHIHKRMQISPFSGIWCGAQSAPSVVYAKLPRHVIRKRRIAISTLYLYQQ